MKCVRCMNRAQHGGRLCKVCVNTLATKHKPQAIDIAYAFMRGEELTCNQARELYGSDNLKGRVHELRRWGLPIRDRWQPNENNSGRHKVYFLERGEA